MISHDLTEVKTCIFWINELEQDLDTESTGGELKIYPLENFLFWFPLGYFALHQNCGTQ